MSKHTPGPWRSNTAYDTKYLKVVCQGDANIVCRVHGGGVSEETAIADARLIAVAPEMLEKLELVCELCNCTVGERASGHLVGCWVPEINVVIRKAKTGAI